jgi:hypothetical protein
MRILVTGAGFIYLASIASSQPNLNLSYTNKDVCDTLFICLIVIIMADALGLASSVITVIDLSAKVASWCSIYYANVKNARDDIKRL